MGLMARSSRFRLSILLVIGFFDKQILVQWDVLPQSALRLIEENEFPYIASS